jgi:CheY-like chemotaxis protein
MARIPHRSFSRTLEKGGYLTRTASSAGAVLDALRDESVDLLITDLSMPDRDGLELIQAIHRELPHLKILAVSAFMHGRFLGIARKLGATEALHKAADPDLLVKTSFEADRLRACRPPGHPHDRRGINIPEV